MTRRLFLALLALLASTAAVRPISVETAPPPLGTPTELGLQGSAKVLCSAVFVCGRAPEDSATNGGFWFMPAAEADKVKWTVDRSQKSVTTSVNGLSRTARFYGDQGGIIDRQGKSGIEFTPVAVKTKLPDAMNQDWPMGDRLPSGPLPSDVDHSKV